MDITFLGGIVLLPIHVEEFVKLLIRIVVVAQGRVKLHTGVQQQFIREFELLPKVSGLSLP
jgi:hypothetical protein